MNGYAKTLEEAGLVEDTVCLELTTLKQIVKWLVGKNLLPAGRRVKLKVTRSRETTGECLLRRRQCGPPRAGRPTQGRYGGVTGEAALGEGPVERPD